MRIYFTDWFAVEPEALEEYGAFNISLVNDLPLFIDPFLLFTSDKQDYCRLHDSIIEYLKFLRDQSIHGGISRGLLQAWYMFPEVKQLWLGYSLQGNCGSGLGKDFAVALNENLQAIFTNFGNEQITRGSHLEKVCLVREGVGRDNISDFTANLIKAYLAEYTQAFARKHIAPELRRTVSVKNAVFDYERRVWCPRQYELPYVFDDYVILTPRDILTRDENWINRPDLLDGLERIAVSVPDEQLRAQVNQYLVRVLKEDSTRDEKRRAWATVIREHPKLIEYYIRSKEDRGAEAQRVSGQKVEESEAFFIHQVQEFVRQLEAETDFYKRGIDTLAEARARVEFLKHEIEHNGGYRIFYRNGQAIQRESDLQILFRLTWCATPSDFNSEVNNGRGPVDFKVSRGSKDKSLVEFKLAKNSKLTQNLRNQVAIYEKANRTDKSLKVIVYFTDEERKRVEDILKELRLEQDDSIILIDARSDNKPSASKT
jgi:CRISPR/Cas system-associated exonuclease Cas4 (RecB family)